MNVDRIAQTMTAGAPSRGFTVRVMAPIHGLPGPDFTARVMQRVAAREQALAAGARGTDASSTFKAGLLLATAVLALAAGAVLFRGSRVTLLTVPPPPPRLAAASQPRTVSAPTRVVDRYVARNVTHSPAARPRAARAIRYAEAPAIYTIAALSAPADLEMKTIEPATCTVPALMGPAPLKVNDLPGGPGGSRNQNFKERP